MPGGPCRVGKCVDRSLPSRERLVADDGGAAPSPNAGARDGNMTKDDGKSAESGATRTRHERVAAGEDGQRVDNFLIRRTPGVPKSHVYRLIRTGDVRVDGRRVRQTRRLREGEQVRIPGLRTTEKAAVRVPDTLADALAAAVVFEHEDFLVVDKPPGIAVHGGTGLAFGVIDALRQRLDAPRLELVHRLDRGTSGCLLIARDNARNRRLQSLFRERAVEKSYVALVTGAWPDTREVIDAPLARNVEHAGERRVVVSDDGQPALSRFRVSRRLPGATLLDVAIETGRTHQIRVHALHAGHAIVGDTRYGDNRTNTHFRQLGLGRLFLHSARLAFDWDGRRTVVETAPGAAWQDAVDALGAMPAE